MRYAVLLFVSALVLTGCGKGGGSSSYPPLAVLSEEAHADMTPEQIEMLLEAYNLAQVNEVDLATHLADTVLLLEGYDAIIAANDITHEGHVAWQETTDKQVADHTDRLDEHNDRLFALEMPAPCGIEPDFVTTWRYDWAQDPFPERRFNNDGGGTPRNHPASCDLVFFGTTLSIELSTCERSALTLPTEIGARSLEYQVREAQSPVAIQNGTVNTKLIGTQACEHTIRFQLFAQPEDGSLNEREVEFHMNVGSGGTSHGVVFMPALDSHEKSVVTRSDVHSLGYGSLTDVWPLQDLVALCELLDPSSKEFTNTGCHELDLVDEQL